MTIKPFIKRTFGPFFAKCIHMAWEYVDNNALLRRGTYLGNSRLLTNTVDGHLMFLNAEDISISPQLFTYGVYEKALTTFYRKTLTPGMHVVEVGSNIGYFTLLAARLVGEKGHVYSFEPDVGTFTLLQDNIDVNIYQSRITAYRYAISDKFGTATLTQPKKHPGSGSILQLSQEFLDRHFDVSSSQTVNITTLDSILFDKNIRSIDVLKMDAEGSELAILRGALKLLERNPNMKIICEYNPEILETNNISGNEFLHELKEYGFIAQNITEQGLQLFDPKTIPYTAVADILLTRTP